MNHAVVNGLYSIWLNWTPDIKFCVQSSFTMESSFEYHTSLQMSEDFDHLSPWSMQCDVSMTYGWAWDSTSLLVLQLWRQFTNISSGRCWPCWIKRTRWCRKTRHVYEKTLNCDLRIKHYQRVRTTQSASRIPITCGILNRCSIPDRLTFCTARPFQGHPWVSSPIFYPHPPHPSTNPMNGHIPSFKYIQCPCWAYWICLAALSSSSLA